MAWRHELATTPRRSTAVGVIGLWLVVSAWSSPAAAQSDTDALTAVGREIYREGMLPSGEPVEAIVQGDVSVDGSLFTCVNCHRPSGWGAIEGDRIVLPVAGPALLAPRVAGYRQRPAYTEETLAVVIRDGIDSAGNPLDPLMPRYRLSDPEMAALVAYLRSLGAEPPPGVTDTEIRFATVITDDVEPSLRDGVMAVLSTFFEEKNRLTRNEVRRSRNGPFYRDYKYKAYRKWVLDPWVLSGPQESWQAQLEAYYEKAPVFAIVSGISGSPWQPIHDFCEKHQLPAILPNTDRPYISGRSYYTMYFSRGTILEAQIVAAHLLGALADVSSPHRVLQVFRDKSGADAAHALEKALRTSTDVEVVSWRLDNGVKPTVNELARRQVSQGATSVVLWLSADELESLRADDLPEEFPPLYLSSTLLADQAEAISESFADRGWLIQPYTLEHERRERFIRTGGWLKSRKIAITNQRVLAQTYFACMMTGTALGHIKRYFSREYFLDSLDHAERMATYSSSYPSLSFGPGQRFLAKGAYVVDLSMQDRSLEERASWLVPRNMPIDERHQKLTSER